jgi:hypothetical protein
MNASNKKQRFFLPKDLAKENQVLIDIVSGETIKAVKGSVEIILEPKSGQILKNELVTGR